MENASKALLIAAAILIVIILVAFGMRVLNATSGSKDSAIATGQAISTAISMTNFTGNFDNKIKTYAGPNKSIDKVCELLELIIENNEKNERKIAVSIIGSEKYGTTVDKMKINQNNTKISYIKDRISQIKENAQSRPNEFKSMHVHIYYDKDGYIALIGLSRDDVTYKSDYNSQIGG